MANDSTVWAVNGPVDHDARLAREQTFAASGGGTGIIGPESLKVSATSTPGAQVQVAPGPFVIAASPARGVGYTNAPGQSYAKTIYQAAQVPIRATSSNGARTDVLGILIEDPEFYGDPASVDYSNHEFWKFHVVQNAGARAVRPEHFASLRRPFLPLAQIQIPASTATIQNSMIRDIRELAYQRVTSRAFMLEPGASSGRQLRPDQTNFVNLETIQIDNIPRWCNRIIIDGELTNLIVRDGTARGTTGRGSSAVGSGIMRGRLTIGSTSYFTDGSMIWQNENWERFIAPIAGAITIPENTLDASFTFQMRYGNFGNGIIEVHDGARFSPFYRLRLSLEEAPA